MEFTDPNINVTFTKAHNRRNLTEAEIADIQSRCKQLHDRCGE